MENGTSSGHGVPGRRVAIRIKASVRYTCEIVKVQTLFIPRHTIMIFERKQTVQNCIFLGSYFLRNGRNMKGRITAPTHRTSLVFYEKYSEEPSRQFIT